MTTLTPLTAPQPTRAVRLVGRSSVRRDAAIRAGWTAVLWLSTLLVVFWWATGGGVQDLAGWETGLLSAARLTGLVAANLLLGQVVTMARLPVLEGPFGQDRLARLHRYLGFLSFDLMLTHVVLVTWAYAAGDLARTPATLWDLATGYPGMLLAAAGTVCLAMAVVTSVRAARRRLRYESWHLLHLYAYLGVGLALPHQLWTGQELLSSPLATAYWWSAWTTAAFAIVVWRFALPLWRSLRHDLRVTSVVAEAPGVVSVYLGGRNLDRMPVRAGQFLLWRFRSGAGWTRAHPYSLSAAPDGRGLRITVKALGDGSAELPWLRPGTRALVEGPFGRLTGRVRSRWPVALIGAGVGITPLRALAEALPYDPGDAVLLYRHTGAPLFGDELETLAAERGLRVVLLPGNRRTAGSWLGEAPAGFDDATALRALVPDIAERDVYVCGPDPWIRSVRRALAAVGAPDDLVHTETFAW